MSIAVLHQSATDEDEMQRLRLRFLRGANPDNLPEGLFDGWVGGW